jgi:hypothetical protein
MKLHLYYVVELYRDDGTELEEPKYDSGPFSNWYEADLKRASHWLHNNRYHIVKHVIDVEHL